MKLHKLSADRSRLTDTLLQVGVDKYALRMVDKGLPLNILVKDMKSPAANILKQEAIASGMDAAVKRGVVSCMVDVSNVLLLGTYNTFSRLIKRLKPQPFGLKELAEDISKIITSEKKGYFYACSEKISIETPLIMGILNVTPDSFSDGGLYNGKEEAINHIDRMVSEGVDIIDIGGMSSRPGAAHVSAEEEIKRIKDGLEYAVKLGKTVSVDTYNYETAQFALNNGAKIINDISGLNNENMLKVCSETGCAVCIMHMKGLPETMQNDTDYDNIINDIKDFFCERIDKALKVGIREDSIILDVGFGFGKTTSQNYYILKYLEEFSGFCMPMLAGISRKSMIGNVVDRVATERLAGTIAANTTALMAGADILRVHDVAQGVDTVKVVKSVMGAGVI